MSTYLLVWNPRRWEWPEIDNAIEAIEQQGFFSDRWSCGQNKSIQRGDRIFLIRLGKNPKGIIGSGIVETGSFEAPHWDEDKERQGVLSQFVNVRFDTLLNADANKPILHREVLIHDPRLSTMHWDTQISGIQVHDVIAFELELMWQDFVNQPLFDFPNEIQPSEIFYEGIKQSIIVNKYERNPKARRECVKYYGAICMVCEIDFGKAYGHIGKDFIHVHHLKPIAEISEEYEVNPIIDLIPVCPNCHAMLHRRKPPYTVEEIKAAFKKQK